MRHGSPTYGKWVGAELSADNSLQLLIPVGFGHGFSVLEDAIFVYKCSNYYNKPTEGGILWNDPALEIDWGVDEPIISEKDQQWLTLAEFKEQSGGGL